MTRKSVLKYVLCNLFTLALTISLVIAEAEAKGGGKNSSPISSSRPPGSGYSKLKTTKIRVKNTKFTRCYNEQMVEIVCPVTKKGVIAGYVVGGVVGVILLFILYIKIKAKIRGRRAALGAQDRDLEGDGMRVQQVSDCEKGVTRRDSSSSGAPPPQYVEKVADEAQKELIPPVQRHVNDPNPSESTTTSPIVSIPIHELAQPNLSQEPPVTTNTVAEPLPTSAKMPTGKNTITNKFKNVLQKFT